MALPPEAPPAGPAARATVVITSAGSLVGHTLLQALAGRRERLRIVGLNSQPESTELFQCDAAWLVPETATGAAFAQRLREILAHERPALVVPGRDEDVAALAALGEAWPGLSSRLLAGSLAGARVMGSTAASAGFARDHGLPFVPTVATDDPQAAAAVQALRREHPLPWIAKPDQGSGSRGVRVLLHQPQLERALQRPGQVLQPMLDPPDELQPGLDDGVPLFWGVAEHRLYAARGWVDRHGQVHPGCRYRMRMTAGRYEHMALCDEPALAALGQAYGQALAAIGWRGPYHLQAKCAADGRLLPIELNGRFGGGTAGRRWLGHDEVAEVLNHWLGGPWVPQDAPNATPGALVLSRPACHALPAQGLAQLQAQGHWVA